VLDKYGQRKQSKMARNLREKCLPTKKVDRQNNPTGAAGADNNNSQGRINDLGYRR